MEKLVERKPKADCRIHLRR